LQLVRHAISAWEPPALNKIAEESHDPFRVLISCILSQQTKDEVTGAASARLYRLADRPETILAVSERRIARAIYPVSFYRTKARTIREVCRTLLTRFAGRVPDSLEALLSLKGVGRKTANLVVTVGFQKPGICVDTHVHRISNRWGYVTTKTPEQTEMALRQKLPKRHWIYYNDLLVPFGQHLCRPISPFCSRCPVAIWCARIGVTIHR
jgi:endonuclease-3